MIYDCFISYQHDDLPFVENLVKTLESRGLTCWYAPRNIVGRYAKAIVHGISHSKVFLLVLDSKSAVSEEVLNEVELAHNIEKNTEYSVIQPVCIERLNFDSSDYQEIMYYIRRIQFVMAFEDMPIEQLSEMIIESQPALKNHLDDRQKSAYITQDEEDIRIQKQNLLLEKFDYDVYFEVFKRYSNPLVLDVGCGTGEMLLNRLNNSHTDYCHYVGIDKSERQLDLANDKYDHDNITFFKMDVEDESYESELKSMLDELSIEKFDIIHISMLLLHLGNPCVVLQKMRALLSGNGTIIIRDIDDGINFAFPDPDNSFDKIYGICARDDQSGYRKMGRQIFHDLVHAGFSNILIQKQGLSTIGMSAQEKETLFQMYFPFTLANAKTMSEKCPWDKELEENYIWYKNCYAEIHDRFMKPDFVFSLGFQTYTAEA